MMQKMISLELNEVNFDLVVKYCAMGKLPNFARALREFKLFHTIAEQAYPQLEPWIQWPTVYSGKSYAEHGVFRLGDIVDTKHDQIWELLEARGVSVGAISPMNARNNCRSADFFIPDPWTVTKVTGERPLHDLYELVRDAVNANAHEGRSAKELGRALLPFLFKYASPSSAGEYAWILARAARHKWARAVFLDRFLSDLFLKLRAQKGTRFASLFLNAGAHIQHHYLYDAAVYDGTERNPDWYSGLRAKGIDPLLFVYQAYDGVLRDMLAQKDTRVLVTTGLSQYPNPRCIYQYRFKDHALSLARLGITGGTVVPRMSRDFLVEFKNETEAAAAERRMSAVACDGKPLMAVENRGRSLFCQIAYFGPAEGFRAVTANGAPLDLADEVALVSIENGLHQTIGFHLDSAIPAGGGGPKQIPLTDVFHKMRSAFSPARETAAATPGKSGLRSAANA
jgi:hypothetical protein